MQNMKKLSGVTKIFFRLYPKLSSSKQKLSHVNEKKKILAVPDDFLCLSFIVIDLRNQAYQPMLVTSKLMTLKKRNLYMRSVFENKED